MRVPGIGAKGAARILNARRSNKLRTLDDLRAAGVVNVRRASQYVLLDGWRPLEQPRLF
jgi:predicted DNA-binding helix-hairpin-helix protein